MQISALLWHVRDLTDQPIYLGCIGLARILPVIAFSLIGGAVADALNRRGIMLVTQACMALLALGLGWLTLSGVVNLGWIYALTALQAIANAFDLPARQSLVPNLVPARDLPNAFSLNSIAFQTGTIVGPVLSGWIIKEWGQGYTYLINAASFLAVILALLLMRGVSQHVRPAQANPRRLVSLEAIKEGVQFIRKQPIILSTMLLDFFATFFSSANTLMPMVARDVLGVGVMEYSALNSAQAIWAVSAALVISQISHIRRQGPVFLGSVVVFGFATIVFGLARSIPLAMLALILVGGADSVSTIIRNTIRQLATPDHIRGRMTSINQIFFMGGPQLGEVEAGVVAQFFGVPFAILSGGIGCLVAVAWVVGRWPQLKRFNGEEPALSSASAS